MNRDNLKQIFSHYIEKFELINDSKNEEYYKWQIVKQFRKEMDNALNSSDSEFADKLYEVKKITANLIDSYTQPFYGLVEFARKEPDTVKSMFLMLYADDGGDLKKRQEKISTFLMCSRMLRDKYFPGSHLYKDDMHSVTGYLFLYDPDNNYFFKATHAQKFADCISFLDDWGSGEAVKLDVYYKMCDMVTEEIKKNNALLKTDASRFSNGWGVDPNTLHEDTEKHILAFDLIYCCTTYNLYNGISFTKLNSKDKKLASEKKEKAKSLLKGLETAQDRYEKLMEAKSYISKIYVEGQKIHHKKYGEGVIVSCSGSNITVEFQSEGQKKLGLIASVTNGIISVDIDGYEETVANYLEYLKKEKAIESAVSYAEKEMNPYKAFLD